MIGHHSLNQLPSRICKVERVTAPELAPLDQLLPLHTVKDLADIPLSNQEGIGQGLLRDAFGRRDVCEDVEISRSQV